MRREGIGFVPVAVRAWILLRRFMQAASGTETGAGASLPALVGGNGIFAMQSPLMGAGFPRFDLVQQRRHERNS